MKYDSLRQGLVLAICPSINGGGGIVPDLSLRGNSLALQNMDASDYPGSEVGRVLDFDGTNDEATRSIRGTLQTTYESNFFTVATWCLVRSFSNSPAIWSLADYTGSMNVDSGLIEFNNTGSQLYIKSANESIGFTGARTYTLDVAAVTNRWHRIVFCKCGSGDNGLLYFDGRLQTSYTGTLQTTIFGSVVQTHRLASYSSNVVPLNGQIADHRVYSRILTEHEIRLLATEPGIGLRPERTSVFFGAQLFNAAWARNANVVISPVGAA